MARAGRPSHAVRRGGATAVTLSGVVKWIVLATVLLGLAILALAGWSVRARMPEFERAVRRLQRRQDAVTRLRRSAEALQERLLALQRQAEAAQRQVTVIQAKRGR